MSILYRMGCTFTDDEKDACVPMLENMIDLHKIAVRKGSSALKDHIPKTEHTFLKIALTLLVKGVEDDERIRHILGQLMYADKYAGKDLLERIIILEGVTLIARGSPPRITEWHLCSLLGEDYMQLEEDEHESGMEGIIEKFLARIEGDDVLPDYREFNDYFMQVDDNFMQLLFAHMMVAPDVSDIESGASSVGLFNNNINSIPVAFAGCCPALIRRVLENMPTLLAMPFCSMMETSGNLTTEEITAAHVTILHSVEQIKQEIEQRKAD